MYCPQCAQERISEATRFCSRCGYLLTGTAELLKIGGSLHTGKVDETSPRSRGIRQGLFMFLLVFLVAPILGMISVFALGIVPWPMGIAIFVLGVGGLLRIAYAMMFESSEPGFMADTKELSTTSDFATSALPPMRDVPASEYVRPTLFDTPVSPKNAPSVTEGTTKLLDE